jgi:hypothetical protein
MTSDVQVLATAAYICRNPVSAGLARRADAWQWSSYAATMRPPAPSWLAVDRLLEMLGSAVVKARSAFRDLVEMTDGV